MIETTVKIYWKAYSVSNPAYNQIGWFERPAGTNEILGHAKEAMVMVIERAKQSNLQLPLPDDIYFSYSLTPFKE